MPDNKRSIAQQIGLNWFNSPRKSAAAEKLKLQARRYSNPVAAGATDDETVGKKIGYPGADDDDGADMKEALKRRAKSYD